MLAAERSGCEIGGASVNQQAKVINPDPIKIGDGIYTLKLFNERVLQSHRASSQRVICRSWGCMAALILRVVELPATT